MKRSTGKPRSHCSNCGRPVSATRGGQCSGCYQRRRRGHEAPGPCRVCGEADPRVLKRHRLAEGMLSLCANHSAVAGRRPITLAELMSETTTAGDRRGPERRGRARDRRAPGARRVSSYVPDDCARLSRGRRAAD